MSATYTRRIFADRAHIEHHLDELFGTAEAGYIAVFRLDSDHTDWFSVRELQRAAQACATLSDAGHNVYVGMGLHPVNRGSHQRGKAEGVCAVPGLYADIDFATEQPAHKSTELPTEDQALEAIRGMPLPPTMIVRSGYGFYPLWLFHEVEPIEGDTDEGRAAKRALVAQTNAGWQTLLKRKLSEVADADVTVDPTADLARVLRPVGVVNNKAGCTPVRVELIHEGGPRYALGDFEEFLPDIDTAPRETTHIDKTEEERGRIEKVLDGCAWMQHTYSNAATLTEPGWFAGMSIVANCRNGLLLAHDYSSPYPNYSPDETRKKAAAARVADKPVRCASVAAKYDGERFCQACPNRGTITSPIELGSRVTINFPHVNGNGRHNHGKAGSGGTEPKNTSANDASGAVTALSLSDFVSYLPERKYIYLPTGKIWEPAGLSRCFPTAKDEPKSSDVVDRDRPVHDLTWAPGMPQIIEGRFLDQGGWIEKSGARTYNSFRPARERPGRASAAEPWIEHVIRLYPDDAGHILDWLAHRVQRPGEKVNHAIVLGGMQGIGKDTILQPVHDAIGPWNFGDVSPIELMGRFNAFLKSVILRVSELRDLGDRDRFGFYEHTKTLISAPPDTVLVDEKNIRAYRTLNVVGVVFTTNHRSDGLYLPAEDRRHFVAWSDATSGDFAAGYWPTIYRWFAVEGAGHVAAFLHERDLSGFDPKAPPPKTPAFWDIVSSGRTREDDELADALAAFGDADAITIEDVSTECRSIDFKSWLNDRRNSRQIPYRFEACGYVAVQNPGSTDRRWKVKGRNQTIYAKRTLSIRDRIEAARERAGRTW